jgi:hypothetical protein
MSFIMCPEKNGLNPLAIAGSGLTDDPILRSKQLDLGRLIPGQNGRDGRDPTVPRTDRPDPASLDGI